jgi:hypothetical protein
MLIINDEVTAIDFAAAPRLECFPWQLLRFSCPQVSTT